MDKRFLTVAFALLGAAYAEAGIPARSLSADVVKAYVSKGDVYVQPTDNVGRYVSRRPAEEKRHAGR